MEFYAQYLVLLLVKALMLLNLGVIAKTKEQLLPLQKKKACKKKGHPKSAPLPTKEELKKPSYGWHAIYARHVRRING